MSPRGQYTQRSSCPLHPYYQAMRPPISSCADCWDIWEDTQADRERRRARNLARAAMED